MIADRLPETSNDSVNLVVSLLVRHPEVSRVVIKPRFAAITFFFIVLERVTDDKQRRLRELLFDHLRAYHDLERRRSAAIRLRVRSDECMTFVEVERDTRTLARDEISLIVELVARSFGDKLFVNPPAQEPGGDDPDAAEDAIGSALDAVRNRKQPKALVGFREERRVLVYFGN